MPTIQTKSDSYEDFEEKFKPKKTTDDCYTPAAVYDCVADYVRERYPATRGAEFIRPFYPGGDFEHADYPNGGIVVDNPPFSILASILVHYLSNGIPFFLFAPHLTLFSHLHREGITAIVCNADVVYENGARVKTSFLTNLSPAQSFVIAGDLTKRINALDYVARNTPAKRHYDPHIVSAALLGKLAARGITWEVDRKDTAYTRQAGGVAIFGGGLLLSETAVSKHKELTRKAEEIKAREADERVRKCCGLVSLTEAEKDLVRSLG